MVEATRKSKRDQFNHSKKVYNSAVKGKRNEKSLLKASNAKQFLVEQGLMMTTKANFIPELQDVATSNHTNP
jgi:hypothetical protein